MADLIDRDAQPTQTDTLNALETLEQEMIELKPCPFCGRDAHIINTGNYFPNAVFYRIVCESSCTMQGRMYKTIEAAAKEWNTREGNT